MFKGTIPSIQASSMFSLGISTSKNVVYSLFKCFVCLEPSKASDRGQLLFGYPEIIFFTPNARVTNYKFNDTSIQFKSENLKLILKRCAHLQMFCSININIMATLNNFKGQLL